MDASSLLVMVVVATFILVVVVAGVLFVIANLARHLSVDPEKALRRTNEKFRRRFRHIEVQLSARGRTLEEAELDEMEAIWQAAKGIAG